MKIITVNNLKKYFPIRSGVFLQVSGYVKALEKVDFEINEQETIGIVGESGCGKSTLGRTIIKIYDSTSGEIVYHNKDGNSYNIEKNFNSNIRKQFRKDVQMIFQNPFDSLDPRMTIGDVIKEPIKVQKMFKSNKEMDDYVGQLLSDVGLYPEYANRYPHEFSGGQRQRIAIARAISVNPRLIICDEPTSALDVSVQSQVINLLKKIQKEKNIAYIFISHNLDVVHHMSDKIIVMYLGNIVEYAESTKLFEEPKHPYTQALMKSIPGWNPKDRKLQNVKLEGEPPSPINPPKGCPFNPRCPHKMEICTQKKPEPIKIDDNHTVACYLYNEKAGK